MGSADSLLLCSTIAFAGSLVLCTTIASADSLVGAETIRSTMREPAADLNIFMSMEFLSTPPSQFKALIKPVA